MQRNLSYLSVTSSGSSSVLGTRSIRMAQELIELLSLDTGKQQGKTGKLCVIQKLLATAKHWFSIVEELHSVIEQIG